VDAGGPYSSYWRWYRIRRFVAWTPLCVVLVGIQYWRWSSGLFGPALVILLWGASVYCPNCKNPWGKGRRGPNPVKVIGTSACGYCGLPMWALKPPITPKW
jgi:hypothetical protein